MKEKNRETKKAQISPELVAKAKAGDQAAFAELYRQTSTELYRSIHSMVHDEDLAWDIQQDTYLRVYENLGKLEHNEAFLPWLRRISVTVTATEMRKRLPVTFTDLTGEDEDQPDLPDFSIDSQPELALDRKETSRLVREILAKLPENQHLILGMRYYEDLSIQEIAEMLDTTPGTVRVHLFRGRKKVEAAVRELEKQGVKLYGLSPMAFLVALMGRMEPAEAAARATAKAVATKAAANAVAVTAKPVTALTFSQMVKGSIGKILIGALSVAAIGGGIWAGAKLLDKEQQPVVPIQPTTTVNAVLLSSSTVTATDEAEDLTEPVVYVTTPAEETTEATEPGESTEPTKPSEQDEYSGTCGEHLTWRFDPETGLLTIEGSGEMDDAVASTAAVGEYDMPWTRFRNAITSVSLPDGLTSIGDSAFMFCNALTNVIIPDTVTRIGPGAFSECNALTYVSIPDSVKSIGAAAFSITGLKSVTIPGNVKTIKESAFRACGLQNVVISNGVTDIESYAFEGNEYLTQVTIPDSVVGIGKEAFYNCCALKSITIPSGVTSIGEHAVGYVFESDTNVEYTKVEDFTISGIAGSAAETYAKENGFTFVALGATNTTELDVILQRLAQDKADQAAMEGQMSFVGGAVTRIDKVQQIGDRYLTKAVRTVVITATEEELARAKQTGTITLQGKEYRYTDSEEQLNAWGKELSDQFEYFKTSDSGAIFTAEYGYPVYYDVFKVGDVYVFEAAAGSGYSTMRKVANEDWIWLDGDTKVIDSFSGDPAEVMTLEAYLQQDRAVNFELSVDENGKLLLNFIIW